MLEDEVHENGFLTVLLPSGRTIHGPLCPDTACVVLGSPGPPCSQRVKGAKCALMSASKNQKKRFAAVVSVLSGTVIYPEYDRAKGLVSQRRV
jgi:hypothetical protein